jgi:Aldo/keto reductase family
VSLLDVALADLLHFDPDVRRQALFADALRRPSAKQRARSAFAVRDVMLGDHDARLRALGTALFGKLDPSAKAQIWLLEAASDSAPAVREAAWNAMRHSASEAEVDAAIECVRNDDNRAVRQAAVRRLGRTLAGAAAPVTEPLARARRALADALTDPFWRVAASAARALGREPPPRDPPLLAITPHDPDPAVVTAELQRRPESFSSAELVALLGEPHEPLRHLAFGELKDRNEPSPLRAARVWLDEPRVPHAAAGVRWLFDGLGEDALELARDILDDDSARRGSRMWAVAWVARNGVAALRPQLRALARDGDPMAIEALISPRADEEDRVLLVAALGNPATTAAAARALCALGAWGRLQLEELSMVDQPPEVQRLLVESAARDGRVARLTEALASNDVATRALALKALVRLEAPAPITTASRDPDPWIRVASLTPETAERLVADPSPIVRREALRLLRNAPVDPASRFAAAEQAAGSADRVQRMHAAALLDAEVPAARAILLRLLHDGDLAVEAAAADRFAAADLDTMARTASPQVRAVAAPKDEPSRCAAPPAWNAGALVVSGAGGLPSESYRHAHARGVKAFFWEPRYVGLTRWLASAGDAAVIAGSYHATPQAIEADVQHALRRLARQSLELFLLFWVRSPARLSDEAFDTLQRLKERGMVGAIGFSTHSRALAAESVAARDWDAVMLRHSAVHPKAEDEVFALAEARSTAVLSFSNTCYGQLVRHGVSAVDCYRYSLAHPAVQACVSAPRFASELRSNLAVASAERMPEEQRASLRALGAKIHATRQLAERPASVADHL